MRMIQKDFEELYGAPLRLDAGSPPDYADRQLYGIHFKRLVIICFNSSSLNIWDFIDLKVNHR